MFSIQQFLKDSTMDNSVMLTEYIKLNELTLIHGESGKGIINLRRAKHEQEENNK